MLFVFHFEQGSGGGGHECCLSFISSRGVVVVGMNAFLIGCFEQGSGSGGHEFRLLFVLSRGVVVDRISPLSRILSEGEELVLPHSLTVVVLASCCGGSHCCHIGRAVSHVSSEEGMAGWRKLYPSWSHVSSEGGTHCWRPH
jgi:hypothetical protein